MTFCAKNFFTTTPARYILAGVRTNGYLLHVGTPRERIDFASIVSRSIGENARISTIE